MNPSEQVGNTTDTATDHIVSLSQITLVLSDDHSNEPEVTPEPELFITDMLGTVPTDEVLTDDVLVLIMCLIICPMLRYLVGMSYLQGAQEVFHQRNMIKNMNHSHLDILSTRVVMNHYP